MTTEMQFLKELKAYIKQVKGYHSSFLIKYSIFPLKGRGGNNGKNINQLIYSQRFSPIWSKDQSVIFLESFADCSLSYLIN